MESIYLEAVLIALPKSNSFIITESSDLTLASISLAMSFGGVGGDCVGTEYTGAGNGAR